MVRIFEPCFFASVACDFSRRSFIFFSFSVSLMSFKVLERFSWLPCEAVFADHVDLAAFAFWILIPMSFTVVANISSQHLLAKHIAFGPLFFAKKLASFVPWMCARLNSQRWSSQIFT